jgi:hypothetical protein
MKKVMIALLVAGPAYGQWPPPLDTHNYGQVIGTFRAQQPIQQPTTRTYNVWDTKDGYRWGTIDVQPGGSFTQWDSKDGYRWGSITR